MNPGRRGFISVCQEITQKLAFNLFAADFLLARFDDLKILIYLCCPPPQKKKTAWMLESVLFMEWDFLRIFAPHLHPCFVNTLKKSAIVIRKDTATWCCKCRGDNSKNSEISLFMQNEDKKKNTHSILCSNILELSPF